MPKSHVTRELEMTTRNAYDKINAVVSITVDGRELPNLEVLGGSLDKAIEMIQNTITESYKIVPPRVTTTEVMSNNAANS